MLYKKKNPKAQRALVLHGEGSLGAYEAGCFERIYEIAVEENGDNVPFFDIVIGTSMGAASASVLVSHFLEKNTWKGSSEKLIEFWEYLSHDSYVDLIPGFKEWWDYLHSINPNIASGKEARRHYSAKEFSYHGIPHMFALKYPLPDTKFFDLQNTWYRYNNQPLRESISKFAKFPIATDYDDDQPRLLLVSTDVQSGSSVTFDSYKKIDGSRKSTYGKDTNICQEDSERKRRKGFVIRYENGIELDHVMACVTTPLLFDYTTIEVEEDTSSKNN